ncbi:MAG: hypothetical protein KA072_07605 [Thermoanaerobaculaceae bacterium]|nr:hypothetical protein [Thermoanaerobaculaceae bacterium]MDI9622152.1 hypothetical protein [Acidobacteriota bacterium]NLH10051.1 hypothetical protein [Holophagae bacterium]HPW54875.1 hypothetical protein [Thermoanaerobaculaceae bacterium]
MRSASIEKEMVATLLRHIRREAEAEDRAVLVAAFRKQVSRALEEARWSFADHFCDKILVEDARNLEAWLVKGHLAWRRFNEPLKALSCFRQVLILGAYDSSNACVARARSSLQQLLEQLS